MMWFWTMAGACTIVGAVAGYFCLRGMTTNLHAIVAGAWAGYVLAYGILLFALVVCR